MKNVVYVENVQVRTKNKCSTTCWLHDVGLYFFPDICLTNWTFWVLPTAVTTNCQMSAWIKHNRSFRLKALFAQTHLLELFEFLSTFILRCIGWPTSFFRCRRTIPVLWLSDWRWRWAFHLLESKDAFHQVCKACKSCVVIINLFKKSCSNFFITETHNFCFSYKWRRLHFCIYSPFQFSSVKWQLSHDEQKFWCVFLCLKLLNGSFWCWMASGFVSSGNGRDNRDRISTTLLCLTKCLKSFNFGI